MKNLLLCLASQKGYEVLKSALPYREKYRFHVCTFKEPGVADSYDGKIRELAASMRSGLIPIQEYQTDLPRIVQEHEIESALCISWRYLFPRDVVSSLHGNVIVAHDSLLPKFRGFAPLATAMIVGERRTGVTFLQVGRAIDDGPVLWQEHVSIESTDTIQVLIEKLIPLYKQGAEMYFEQAFGAGRPQDESLATYSLWRDEADYEIDWSLEAERIERTIRALGTPYAGARTRLAGDCIVIHRATLRADLPFAIRQPGKVWELDELGRPTVVCGRGLLRIDEATCHGTNWLPLKKLRGRFG
jgi:methionyl-tRNA formyltransferase